MMKQGYELKIEQSQKLALTPSLLQAINVLQLNTMQLEQYVQEQLLSNPMLEVDESERADEPKAIDWAEYARSVAYEPERQDEDPEDDVRETASRSGVTLAEYLSTELQFSKLREDILPVCLYIACCLDEDGYLRVSLEEIAEQTGADVDTILQALLHVQGMEPAGVGARNLTECLSLQLIRAGLDTPLAMLLVKEHLEDIAANRIGALAKELGVKPAAVQDTCDLIRTLDPKPGRQFGKDAEAQYVIPDVFIELRDGKLAVSVSESASPRLIISPFYRHLLEDPGSDEQLKDFLEGRLNSAAWLIRSIRQRSQTIVSVTSAIAEVQEAFLTNRGGLVPMTLAQIAGMAGVHESTVSRCTSGKYVQTPRGLFELKDLFGGGLAAGSGEVSSDSVKKAIRQVIENENDRAPLSDQAIAEKLKQENGVNISRRTVTKYREAMGIPSSTGRKRFE
ncbi:MAG: RNA polymerase factor sigma-54 [Firmicutes bacterium]|nr:RNA polymerase factor sigma-54 [Bacillota bacterium]